MNGDERLINPDGFALESADSVRFGEDYSEQERERNRQVLVGEAMCGLLLGEPLWTNMVYAFDSVGMVELLGALAKAFVDRDEIRFLPLQVCVYGGDRDTFGDQAGFRPWESFDEIFLRAYAHRLNNPGFILSALPDLNRDEDQRRKLGAALVGTAGGDWDPGDLPDLPQKEREHMEHLWAIDRFLRKKTLRTSEPRVKFDPECTETPIRLNRSGWESHYQDPKLLPIASLNTFAAEAVTVGLNSALRDHEVFVDSWSILKNMLEGPGRHRDFANRSVFRAALRRRGCSEEHYRVLVEFADGQYNLMQYKELSHASRDVTSPASDSLASQLGEQWAQEVTRSLRRDGASEAFEFVNGIQAIPQSSEGQSPVGLDVDRVFEEFANIMDSDKNRVTFQRFQTELYSARCLSGESINQEKLVRLADLTEAAVDTANKGLRGLGLGFHFNAGARSLSIHFNDWAGENRVEAGGILANGGEDSEWADCEEKREGATNCDR